MNLMQSRYFIEIAKKYLAENKLKKWYYGATIIIAVAAIAGPIASILLSSRQFELANRPFLEIIDPSVSIQSTSLDRGILPEVIFDVEFHLINHGSLPAHVKRTESFFQSLGEDAICQAMSDEEDKEEQWHNFDIFPYIEGVSYGKKTEPLINVKDVKNVMNLNKTFYENIKDKNYKFWNTNTEPTMKQRIKKQVNAFYLILQIEYYKMGDNYNDATPYFYSVKFKINKGLVRQSHFVKSANKRWFGRDKNKNIVVLDR